jgi:hypothetical protein
MWISITDNLHDNALPQSVQTALFLAGNSLSQMSEKAIPPGATGYFLNLKQIEKLTAHAFRV